MRLSIIIPAYNEEKRIKDTLEDINNYLSEKYSLFEYEIIVVNDGSIDDTKLIIQDLQKKFKTIKFFDNKINSGKGAAVKQGMLAATGDYKLFMDADNAIKINHLDKFLEKIKNYDLVIGSIEVPGSIRHSEYEGASKVYRTLLARLSKYLIRFTTVWEIHDTQRAFKLFTKDAAEKIFSRQTIHRWGFDIEVLVIAKKLGYHIKELPVEWINPPGRVNFSDYIKTLKELFEIKINSIKGRYK